MLVLRILLIQYILGEVRKVEVENLVENGRVDPLPHPAVLGLPEAIGVDDRVARARGILTLEVGHLDHVNLFDTFVNHLLQVCLQYDRRASKIGTRIR